MIALLSIYTSASDDYDVIPSRSSFSLPDFIGLFGPYSPWLAFKNPSKTKLNFDLVLVLSLDTYLGIEHWR